MRDVRGMLQPQAKQVTALFTLSDKSIRPLSEKLVREQMLTLQAVFGDSEAQDRP